MERTKRAIVDAFQQILEETPINKITVKSIVERCGINRNTFYYYFTGIPELVEYHLTAMADQLIDSFDQPVLEEELQRIVRYFAQRKKSVLHIYRYYPREEFIRFLDKIAAYIVEKNMDRATKDTPISEEGFTILTRYYKSVMIGNLLDWLEARMDYDMEATVTRLCELMSGTTRRAIEKSRQSQM